MMQIVEGGGNEEDGRLQESRSREEEAEGENQQGGNIERGYPQAGLAQEGGVAMLGPMQQMEVNVGDVNNELEVDVDVDVDIDDERGGIPSSLDEEVLRLTQEGVADDCGEVLKSQPHSGGGQHVGQQPEDHSHMVVSRSEAHGSVIPSSGEGMEQERKEALRTVSLPHSPGKEAVAKRGVQEDCGEREEDVSVNLEAYEPNNNNGSLVQGGDVHKETGERIALDSRAEEATPANCDHEAEGEAIVDVAMYSTESTAQFDGGMGMERETIEEENEQLVGDGYGPQGDERRADGICDEGYGALKEFQHLKASYLNNYVSGSMSVAHEAHLLATLMDRYQRFCYSKATMGT